MAGSDGNKQKASKPTSQQASKPASQQDSKAENQKARKPESQVRDRGRSRAGAPVQRVQRARAQGARQRAGKGSVCVYVLSMFKGLNMEYGSNPGAWSHQVHLEQEI